MINSRHEGFGRVEQPGITRRGIVRFGVFEADLANRELRKSGLQLKIQEQPFQVLAALLGRPGDLVTREELQALLWPNGTFVDFDRGLNAAVARLRQVLQDSAERPRYVETVARRGYRFIGPVTPGAAPPEDVATGSSVVTSGTENGAWQQDAVLRRRIPLAAVITLCGFAGVAALLISVRSSPEPLLEQITRDRGLNTDPTLSPDGQLLVYASDGGGSNLNIWLRQLVTGGAAVQLTHEKFDARQPSFSPDGRTIAYRSERDGGGVDVIPTIGGQPVRVAAGGRNPRFSPDGKWIAYWVGAEKGSVPENDPSGQIHVVPSGGGQPNQVGIDLPPGGNPVWSSDSRRLLVYANPRVPVADPDWWIVPLDHGPARKTGAFQALRSQGFIFQFASAYPRAAVWLEDELIFSGRKGDTRNVWRVPFRSADGQITGKAKRLTQGTTSEVSPSFTRGVLAFTSLVHSTAVWAIPIRRDREVIAGELQRMTEGNTSEVFPSVSADGRLLVYASTVPSEQSWLKDLQTGRAFNVSEPSKRTISPVISRDGSQVAFLVDDAHDRGIYVRSTTEGAPRRVGSQALWIHDWSPDNRDLLVMGANEDSGNRTVMRLDLETGGISEFLSKSGSSVYQPRYSPDGRWLAFEIVPGRGTAGFDSRSRLYVVRLHGRSVATTENWIPVSDPDGFSDKPRWSLDGNSLYFISHRDGFRCLWAQRLEPSTKHSSGDPTAVYHFHNSRVSPMNVGLSWLETGIASDKIVITLGELTGNIWTLRIDP